MSEQDRLAFMCARDGYAASVAFATQTMRVYRTSVLHSRKHGFEKNHHATLPEYKRGFIQSYLVCKRYVLASRVVS